MSEAERTIHMLIIFAGVYELAHGSWAFLRGEFPPLTVLRKSPLTGNTALVVSLLDVLLGVIAILYGGIGWAAPTSAIFTGLNRYLPLPERGAFTLDLLNGETVDLNAALFFLQWGFLAAVVSASPSFLQRERHKPAKKTLDEL